MKWTLLAALLAFSANTMACDSYKKISRNIDKRYQEQLLFTGISKSIAYEFWANRKRGSWSLVQRSAHVFNGRTKECAKLMLSGKGYAIADDSRNTFFADIDPDFNPAITARCIQPSTNSLLLWGRYSELPIVHAIGTDVSIVIYSSPKSWTLTRLMPDYNRSQWCVQPGASGKQSFVSAVDLGAI